LIKAEIESECGSKYSVRSSPLAAAQKQFVIVIGGNRACVVTPNVMCNYFAYSFLKGHDHATFSVLAPFCKISDEKQK
jgi:hypothetical protein